jgi:hypothetical protein
MAISIETSIPTGNASQIEIPFDVITLETAYAPNADITPCAKFVVKDVLNINVIAIVTRAVTHIGTIDPNNVLRKYAINYPH